MTKYESLDQEIEILTKMYFELTETARGWARQGDTEMACELMDQIKVLRRKLRAARTAKAFIDDPQGRDLGLQVGQQRPASLNGTAAS